MVSCEATTLGKVIISSSGEAQLTSSNGDRPTASIGKEDASEFGHSMSCPQLHQDLPICFHFNSQDSIPSQSIYLL